MFNDYDRADSPFVALVNDTMARMTWPGQNPVGRRFQTPSTDWKWFEVVGVVGDTRYYGLASEPKAEMYVPHQQVPRSYMNVVLRTRSDPTGLTVPVRNEIFKQDSGQPSHSIVSLETLIADSIAAERFYALVLGVFASIAVVLAGAGIYGVLSYWVNQRTHEIGVRMALGATRKAVLKSVVGHGMTITVVGIGLGLIGTWATGRVLSSTLFGIGAGDPLTLVGVTSVLTVIALLACGIPALRASRVDPLIALREE
jgi:putative ABC transport system permease protein